MFGKKKANKTIDKDPASADTSSGRISGGLSDTREPFLNPRNGDEAKSAIQQTGAEPEKPSAPQLFTKPRTKEEPQMSSKPHSTSFRPEIPKRPLEIPTRGGSGRPASAPANNEGKKLTVGRDIRLAGEIGSCDVLVVEGQVEAQIKDCTRLEVAQGGTFVGSALVEEAEISGTFDGDLSARRVVVIGSANITGKITYGTLQIENGARIKGTLEYVEGNDDGTSRNAPSAAITIPRKSDDI